MVPVMEDKLLAQRWAESAYNIDSLLAYSSVCGTGLDTIPLPGDVTADQLNRIFSDVASLAVKWNKPLSARFNPSPTKNPATAPTSTTPSSSIPPSTHYPDPTEAATVSIAVVLDLQLLALLTSNNAKIASSRPDPERTK